MRDMLALVLHLGGVVGECVSDWGWSVHPLESKDSHTLVEIFTIWGKYCQKEK